MMGELKLHYLSSQFVISQTHAAQVSSIQTRRGHTLSPCCAEASLVEWSLFPGF